MSRIYDVTVPVHPQLPVWPESRQFKIWQSSRMSDGEICNVSDLSMCVHTGTHIDAPLHFVEGMGTTNEIPLSQLVGDCQVVELGNRTSVSANDLEGLHIAKDTKKLLIKTDNSRLWENDSHDFFENYCALNTSAAEWIRDFGIHLVGIDYLSVSLFKDPPEWVHQILLAAEIVLVEGLNLTEVSSGRYRLTCLPLKIKNAEGAPARVILEDFQDER